MLNIIFNSNDSDSIIKTEVKDPLVLRACQLRREFFTPEILTEICTRLVTYYFLLTPTDLEMWDSQPENFGKYLYIILLLFRSLIIIKMFKSIKIIIRRFLEKSISISAVDDGGESWKYSLRVS